MPLFWYHPQPQALPTTYFVNVFGMLVAAYLSHWNSTLIQNSSTLKFAVGKMEIITGEKKPLKGVANKDISTVTSLTSRTYKMVRSIIMTQTSTPRFMTLKKTFVTMCTYLPMKHIMAQHNVQMCYLCNNNWWQSTRCNNCIQSSDVRNSFVSINVWFMWGDCL